MRWWTRLILSIVISAVTSASEPISAQESTPSLIERSQCGHFLMVLGRLRLDEARYNKLRREEAIEGSEAGTEYVSVTADRGIPSLHYLRQTTRERLSVDVAHARQVTIESTLLGATEPQATMRLFQPRVGMVEWSIAAANAKVETYRAPSLWHLYTMQPKLFETWICPILKHLFPASQQPLELDQIDEQLVTSVLREDVRPLQWDEVATLVAKLGATKRCDRMAAQTELIRYGVRVLPLLAMIDEASLDAEQRSSLTRIREHLEPRGHDSLDLVSCWLAHDYHFCEQSAQRWQPSDRQRISERLALACGRPLPHALLLPTGTKTEVAVLPYR